MTRIRLAIVLSFVLNTTVWAEGEDGHLWGMPAFHFQRRFESNAGQTNWPAQVYAFLLDDHDPRQGLKVRLKQFTASASERLILIHEVYAGAIHPAYYCPFEPTLNAGAALTDWNSYYVSYYNITSSQGDYLEWTLPPDAAAGLDTVVFWFAHHKGSGVIRVAVDGVIQSASVDTALGAGPNLYPYRHSINQEYRSREVPLDTATLGPGNTLRVFADRGSVYLFAAAAYARDGICTNGPGEHRYMNTNGVVNVQVAGSADEWVMQVRKPGFPESTLRWIGSFHNTKTQGNGHQHFPDSYAPHAETWTDGPWTPQAETFLGTAASPRGGYWTGDLRLHRAGQAINEAIAENDGCVCTTTEEYRLQSSRLGFSVTLDNWACTLGGPAIDVNMLYGAMFDAASGDSVRPLWLMANQTLYNVMADCNDFLQLGAATDEAKWLWNDERLVPVGVTFLGSNPSPTSVFLNRSSGTPSVRKLYWMLNNGPITIAAERTLQSSWRFGPASPSPRNDYDKDEDVDQDDYAALYACLAGPQLPPMPEAPVIAAQCLAMFDYDDDGDIDLLDCASFQRAFHTP